MNKIIKYNVLLLAMLFTGNVAFAQTDSLNHYLELAARNNPLLQSEFSTYKASLEKVPQAGAFADPQLEMGFFLMPMEVLDGKQIADFKLMQMFPWFGTRKAARSEATEMARMSFEKFRESRDNLFLEVKSQWYTLSNLHQRLKNIRENKELLLSLKDLAMSRFSSPVGKGAAVPPVPKTNTAPQPESVSSGSMSGMGGGASATTTGQASGITMESMSGGGGNMGGASAGMSDVLRVQLEINELENDEQTALSQIISAEAKFNALLNRPMDSPVIVQDSITQQVFVLDDMDMMKTIQERNPMLGMITAETKAYKAKQEMDKRMGLPMIGIGVQYSLIGERMPMGIPTTDMNGKDMIMPMVSLSIPIYRKKYNAQQKEGRLLWQAGKEKYTNTLNSLAANYVDIRQQLADAARKIELYDKQQDLSLTTYQLAIKEFASGQNSMTNVLDIQRQLLDYQFKRSESVTAYNIVTAMIENLLSESETE